MPAFWVLIQAQAGEFLVLREKHKVKNWEWKPSSEKKNGPPQEGCLWNLYYLVPELHQFNMSLGKSIMNLYWKS